MPPTGKRFSARQSHWYRVVDGKFAEHWATREDLPTMLQLGVLSAPGGP
jgi:predicted ester cyclase